MRILLVKTSSLGDVIHNLPVATDLRQQFPTARIDWMVEEGFADIPRLHPAVERVIPVALRRWRKALFSPRTWAEFGAFGDLLDQAAYDVVLDTQGLLKSALLALKAPLGGDGVRVGMDRDSAREPLAARFYHRRYAVARGRHAVERNRQLAAAAFGYTVPATLDYGIEALPLRADWLGEAPYAVLLTATSRADKLWPEAHWVELGRALAASGRRVVLPSGSPEEQARARRIAEALPDAAAAAVAAPPLSIAMLAQLFAGADRVIGLDTGLTHLAAALDRPTVALFTGSDPVLTGVHAGPRAINIGGAGQTPAVADVLAAMACVLAA